MANAKVRTHLLVAVFCRSFGMVEQGVVTMKLVRWFVFIRAKARLRRYGTTVRRDGSVKARTNFKTKGVFNYTGLKIKKNRYATATKLFLTGCPFQHKPYVHVEHKSGAIGYGLMLMN